MLAMAPIELQDRAQYLSLALFAQKVISALIEYVDEGKSQRLKAPLDEALSSLIQMKRSPIAAHSRAAAFSSYEHIRTLEEVWTAKEREDAVKIIKAVLRSPSDLKTKRDADKLIKLFSKLQNQALWNFEQPKPVSQKVMQRLCQMA
jgi:hypothetical protein